MANGVEAAFPFARLAAIELRAERAATKAESLEREIVEFKADVKDDLAAIRADIVAVRNGQRSLIFALLTASTGFLGLAVAIFAATGGVG